MITMALVQQKNKNYDLKFKLSVLKYAEEKSGETAARHFSVDPKRVRDWWKTKMELQCLSEEDSKRASLHAEGRKKAELSVNGHAARECLAKWSGWWLNKCTPRDSRDEEFAASAGWLNHFLRRNNFTCRRQLLPRRMPENSPRSWRSLWHFHPGFLWGRT